MKEEINSAENMACSFANAIYRWFLFRNFCKEGGGITIVNTRVRENLSLSYYTIECLCCTSWTILEGFSCSCWWSVVLCKTLRKKIICIDLWPSNIKMSEHLSPPDLGSGMLPGPSNWPKLNFSLSGSPLYHYKPLWIQNKIHEINLQRNL